MKARTVPIFLLSQPRGGSTLLQRLLSTHPDVATAPEPWILLPLLTMQDPEIASARYQWSVSSSAVRDFVKRTPQGQEILNGSIRSLALNLYESAALGGRYFIDKTPRYALVINELIETFPDARYLILWRNPLAVAASMVETWGRGYWCLFRHESDLVEIPSRLVAASALMKPENRFELSYEALVAEPEKQLRAIYEWLDLDFHRPHMDSVRQGPESVDVVGDRWGSTQYSEVSQEPIEKWLKTFLGSPLRRAWARRYLKRLGDDVLGSMGYSRAELSSALDGPTKERSTKRVMDPILISFGPLFRRWDSRVWWLWDDRIRSLLAGRLKESGGVPSKRRFGSATQAKDD
jgi:hypothetical protein